MKKMEGSVSKGRSILSPSAKLSVRRRKVPQSHGYITLLHAVSKTSTPLVVRTVPQEELVFNSYHEDFHMERWKAWTKHVPKWILKDGLQGLQLQYEKENISDSAATNQRLSLRYSPEEDKTVTLSHTEANGDVKQWRDWSLQLTESGRLLITGKTVDNTIQQSRDISSCERVDSNTLVHSDGVVYELVGMPDHFTNLPYYVRNRFQCGFPQDWKAVKQAWMQYIKQGSPWDFNWIKALPRASPALKEVNESATGSLASQEVVETPRAIVKHDDSRKSHSRTKQPMDRSLQRHDISRRHTPQPRRIVATVRKRRELDSTLMKEETALQRWLPVLVEGCSLKIKGYIVGTSPMEEVHTTDVVESRKASDSFRCKNGKMYKLVGPYADPANTLPSDIKRRLAQGLPTQWKLMVSTWGTNTVADVEKSFVQTKKKAVGKKGATGRSKGRMRKVDLQPETSALSPTL